MPVIHIHTSPLSKRMIESRYGTAYPITLRQSDLLYNHLHFRILDESKTNFAKTKKLLTEKVAIQVNVKLSKFLSHKHRNIRVGLHLHKIYLNEANLFIEAQSELGETRMGALKTFIQIHKIAEDDFGLESFYKNWQRWEKGLLEKKIQNHCRHKSPVVLQKNAFAAMPKSPPLWTEILAAVAYYYNIGKENLFMKSQSLKTIVGTFERKFNPSTACLYAHPRHMMYYLIHEHCGFTSDQIATLLPQSARMIRHAVAQIRDQAQLYDYLATEIEDLERFLNV